MYGQFCDGGSECFALENATFFSGRLRFGYFFYEYGKRIDINAYLAIDSIGKRLSGYFTSSARAGTFPVVMRKK